MKRIGFGWQYTVYDLGNNRVLKKYHTRLFAYFVMLKDSFPYTKHQLWNFDKYYTRCRNEALESMKQIPNVKIEKWMMGNPVIIEGVGYEQDKITPLRICIRQSFAERGREIIDAFIQFNKHLVGNSFIDRNFNIGDNFGMNSNGHIVLMDLGETCSDVGMIRDYLEKRPWAAPDVVNVLPKELRKYFVFKMDAAFVSAK